MNILGISGSIGWDGNIPFPSGNSADSWVHGSGATLIMNGELKTALMEERFSRIKYDGNYPKLSIQKTLDQNELTKYDIDLVVYVCGAPGFSFNLKQVGYIEEKLQEYFPNCKVDFLGHHMAHTAATFYSSGFDEANVLSFDGAGDYELQPNGDWLIPHMKFSQGKDLTLTEITTWYINIPPLHAGLGILYNIWSEVIYKKKMNLVTEGSFQQRDIGRETCPGKVMGLAAYGDYQKIDLPDLFHFECQKEHTGYFPQLHNSSEWLNLPHPQIMKYSPEDAAAWSQHQFEKYLLLFLSNISKTIKSDNLCLGGGCALNILANTKIIEQGIYKNVHVNTAPADDGLHFGAALYKAVEYENKITLPDDIGYLGIPYTDEDIEKALC